MPQIDTSHKIQTVISTYEVSPADCQDLLDHLTALNRDVMRRQPGFVSASLHVNDAQTRVASYAQWRDRDAFLSMLRSPEMRPHIKRAAELCERFEPVLYDLQATIEA